MSISQLHSISIDEFYKLREDTENGLEYIDGIVYMTYSEVLKGFSIILKSCLDRKYVNSGDGYRENLQLECKFSL